MRRRLQVDMEQNVFSMIQCALTGAILRIASKFWPPLFSFHLNPNPIVRKGWFHHYTRKKNAMCLVPQYIDLPKPLLYKWKLLNVAHVLRWKPKESFPICRYPRGGAVRPYKSNRGTAVFHPEMSSTYEKTTPETPIFCWRISVFFERDPFSLAWTFTHFVACSLVRSLLKSTVRGRRGRPRNPKNWTKDDFETHPTKETTIPPQKNKKNTISSKDSWKEGCTWKP